MGHLEFWSMSSFRSNPVYNRDQFVRLSLQWKPCGTFTHLMSRRMHQRPSALDFQHAGRRTWRMCNNTRAQASTPAIHIDREPVLPEEEIEGMSAFLDSLKWDANGLVAAVVQHVDTGEVLMQAYANRAAVAETLQTRLATFWTRSRQERWCKGETSGHYIRVSGVFPDCDRDSLIYLGDPIGPACHTGAAACWFSQVDLREGKVREEGSSTSREHAPASTLLALERIISDRIQQAKDAEPDGGQKPSWTVRLAADPALLCRKVREEAGELCQTLEENEGRERTASEAADLLYHSLVLLQVQGVEVVDVLSELRRRFGTSGVEEKASRKK